MSEYSESYHLYSESHDEAIELLHRAKLRGYVFESNNHWVSLVCEGKRLRPNIKLVQNNRGLLLHYICQEDHNCSFAFYQNDRVVNNYRCDWNSRSVKVDDSLLNRVLLQQFMQDKAATAQDELWNHLHPKSFDNLQENQPAYSFASAVGLPHFEWLAYDDIELYLEHSENNRGKVYKVSNKQVEMIDIAVLSALRPKPQWPYFTFYHNITAIQERVSFALLVPTFLPASLPLANCGYVENDPDVDESVRLFYEYPPRLRSRNHRDITITVDQWKTKKTASSESVAHKFLGFGFDESKPEQIQLRDTSGFMFHTYDTGLLWQEKDIFILITCGTDPHRSKPDNFGFQSYDSLLLKIAESLRTVSN
jgi:hypothetical protein